MNKSFLLIALLFLSVFGFSQNDEKAVSILDEVVVKVDNYTSLKIDFLMLVENNQSGTNNPFIGSAIYKNGNYKLDMMGQVIFSDGKTNWTYLKDADEVNITNNSDGEEIMVNPKNLLKGYKDNFKIRFIADKFEKNRPLVEIDLYPKVVDGKKYSRISLKIDKTKKQIYSVRYVGKDGVNYLIEINKFEENPSISDNEIKYNDNLFPGAEIIDMRF